MIQHFVRGSPYNFLGAEMGSRRQVLGAQGPGFVFSAAQASQDNPERSPPNPCVRGEEKVNTQGNRNWPRYSALES